MQLACGCALRRPPAALPPPAAATVAAPAPPDLSPTPEPEGLVAFARATKPSEAIKVVGGWVQMPMPGPAEVGSLVAGESTGNLIDLDQPIDFALAMHGREPRGAISAAVRSLDEARAAFSKYKLVPAANGAFRVEGLGKPAEDPGGAPQDQDSKVDKDDDERGEARVCQLVPAFGPAATRLICAESLATLHELAPWLARTATRATYPADLHVELRLAPLRPLVDQMRRVLPMFAGSALGMRHTGVPAIDDAFRAAVDDVADLTSDADTIDLDAMLGEPQGTVTVTSRFRSTTSLLARLAVAHPERAEAAPAAFWKLPADADVAVFHSGVDAADFEHPRDHVADVIGAALAQGGLGDADRKAIRDAASHTLDLVALRSEYAKGLDVDAAAKAVAAIKARRSPGTAAAHDEAERVAAEKMAGMVRDRARRPCRESRRAREGVGDGVGAPRSREVGPLESHRRPRADRASGGAAEGDREQGRGAPRNGRLYATPGRTRFGRHHAGHRESEEEARAGEAAHPPRPRGSGWERLVARLRGGRIARSGEGEGGARDGPERARVPPGARADEGREGERGGLCDVARFRGRRTCSPGRSPRGGAGWSAIR